MQYLSDLKCSLSCDKDSAQEIIGWLLTRAVEFSYQQTGKC